MATEDADRVSLEATCRRHQRKHYDVISTGKILIREQDFVTSYDNITETDMSYGGKCRTPAR